MNYRGVIIDGKRGEYTGIQPSTGMHTFSMYDGDVIRRYRLEEAVAIDGEPLYPYSCLPLPLVGGFYPSSFYPCHIPLPF